MDGTSVLPGALLQLDLVDYLVVNEIEYQALAGPQVIAGIKETAQTLSRTHKLAFIVTLGSEGALCVDSDHVFRVPVMPTRVVETTEACDAFVGSMAQALDRDANLEATVTWTCATGAIACSCKGAIPSYPDRAEITHFMNSD